MGKASGSATQRGVCIDKAVVLLGRTDIRLSCSGLKVICRGTADPKCLPCPRTVSPFFSYRCSCLVPQVVSRDYCAMWPARYICSTIGQFIFYAEHRPLPQDTSTASAVVRFRVQTLGIFLPFLYLLAEVHTLHARGLLLLLFPGMHPSSQTFEVLSKLPLSLYLECGRGYAGRGWRTKNDDASPPIR